MITVGLVIIYCCRDYEYIKFEILDKEKLDKYKDVDNLYDDTTGFYEWLEDNSINTSTIDENVYINCDMKFSMHVC